MTSPLQNGFGSNGGVADAERTLRLIATLPAPQGLEERVKAGLHAAPARGIVVAWPFGADRRGWISGASARAAAAAAIVLVVVGGGWGVYSHIQVAATPSAVVLPQMPTSAGGFSAAGATRKPQTVEGPVVAAPIKAKQDANATTGAKTKAELATARKDGVPARHAHRSPKMKNTPIPAER